MIVLSGGNFGGFTLESITSKIATAPKVAIDTPEGEEQRYENPIEVGVTNMDDNTISIDGWKYDISRHENSDTADFIGME